MPSSAPTLASLLAESPRLLSASELHARIALIEATAQAYRSELLRRPSHCQLPPPQKASAIASSEMALLSLPAELVARALSLLPASQLAMCAKVSTAFYHNSEEHTQQQGLVGQPTLGLVEQALRLRAEGKVRVQPK